MIFSPSANLVAAATLLLVAFLGVVGLVCWWWWPRTALSREVAWPVVQPVPFSHQHHVAGLGIDCRFCHSSVEVAADAGLPPTTTCMTCHSQIWTNAAVLAPVRASLADGKPLVWKQINDLPGYVYFNHSIHIAKGVGCASCHGAIDEMAFTAKAASLTMQFCLDCHRDPGPQLRPADQVFNLHWQRDAATPSVAALLQRYHIGVRNLTDCSICHR